MASRSGMIPPVGVYLVLLPRIASIAACLIWSGVGKSGSPGPKSAISTPLAFSWSAAVITAAVGEICMRLMRSVSFTSSPRGNGALSHRFRIVSRAGLGRLRTSGNLRAQPLLYDRRHQSLERRSQLRNLAHQLRTQIAVGDSRQHENGLEPRLQFPVHQRHLQFVLVIAYRANPAQNHPRALLPRV